jgi:hypothetical protein
MKNFYLLLILLVLVGGLYFYDQKREEPIINFGSVVATHEYKATTTPWNDGNWTDQLIDQGHGALGSVVITQAGNLHWHLLNATTTNTSDDGNSARAATSTLLLATFPPDAAAGTYTFDVTYTNGLYLDVESGTIGSSTITYR